MKLIFRSVIDVRKGESTLTLLMLTYYFLILVTYCFLKAARDALFIYELGADRLPIVFMLIAVVVVPVITLYSRASRKLELNRLINVTTLIIVINLAILRLLLGSTQPAVFYIFYIWVSIYGALATAQFWLLANAVFDATQAKRLFVPFGLGGSIGGFAGGEIQSILVDGLGVSTENLLFFCIAFLVVCMFLLNKVWAIKQGGNGDVSTQIRKKSRHRESHTEIFRTIQRSRHLLLIVGIVAMTMATASFVDYQFKIISGEAFATKPELTSFFAKFYGRVSLLSFVFQLLVSYRFLRVFGVTGAIAALPLVLLSATTFLLVSPGLLAAVLLRGSGDLIKYSIDKTGRELLFLPVPLEVKQRTKMFIDIFVDRWFRGFAGGALFLLTSVAGMSVLPLSFVVLAMLGIWLTLVWMMRKEYVNAFRKALDRREIDPGDLRVNIEDSATLESLREALTSSNERQIIYALEMLDGVKDSKIFVAVRPLLQHQSGEVRACALKMLRTTEDDTLVGQMEGRLKDRDPSVRRDAMYYLCRRSDVDQSSALENYLNDKDPQIQTAALGCITEYGSETHKYLVSKDVISRMLSLEGEDGEIARGQVAETLGLLKQPQFKSYLVALMNDPAPEVARKAMLSVGRTRDRELLPRLLGGLADRQYRRAARDALAAFGDRIVGTLGDYTADSTVPISVRSNLCRVLGRIPSQRSVDTLISTLAEVEPPLKYHVIRALNSLRSDYTDLRFPGDAIDAALIDETETYYAMLQMIQFNGSMTPGAKLLEKALGEQIDRNFERIFRLLGLRYSPKDIHGAYLGIISDNRQMRGNAVEFLDNVLKKKVKKYLFPIVDNVSDDFKIKTGQELFGVELTDRNSALEYLIGGADPWLASCAIYNVEESSPPKLRTAVKKRRNDPHPIVSETARAVLVQISC